MKDKPSKTLSLLVITELEKSKVVLTNLTDLLATAILSLKLLNLILMMLKVPALVKKMNSRIKKSVVLKKLILLPV